MEKFICKNDLELKYEDTINAGSLYKVLHKEKTIGSIVFSEIFLDEISIHITINKSSINKGYAGQICIAIKELLEKLEVICATISTNDKINNSNIRQIYDYFYVWNFLSKNTYLN
jgi:hypothetical protein